MHLKYTQKCLQWFLDCNVWNLCSFFTRVVNLYNQTVAKITRENVCTGNSITFVEIPNRLVIDYLFKVNLDASMIAFSGFSVRLIHLVVFEVRVLVTFLPNSQPTTGYKIEAIKAHFNEFLKTVSKIRISCQRSA